jgi:hypothetical protein
VLFYFPRETGNGNFHALDCYLICNITVIFLSFFQSQRAVKVKLQVLEKEAQKKLEKQREEREKVDKQNKKIMEKDLKHQQRLEVGDYLK